MLIKWTALLLSLIFLTSCSGEANNPGVADTPPVKATCLAGEQPLWSESPTTLQRVYAGLSFTDLIGLYQEPGNNDTWYAIEKAGRIYRFANYDGVTVRTLILDIRDSHVNSWFEGGLLGMAFDPDFKNNGHVYLSYTSSDNPTVDSSSAINFRSVISRATFNLERTAIDMATEKTIIVLPQPGGNHNGGHIAFGADGNLYIGFGDGGSGGNPNDSQDTTNLFGALLRITVMGVAETDKQIFYNIPTGNPLSGSCEDGVSDCPEIYAWGFRNPWRWSFDRNNGDLWLADVGQNNWEEVDRIEAGKNYGWPCREGKHVYSASSCAANISYAEPLIEYSHTDGNSITGGYVYRGTGAPDLQGKYIYGDFGNGSVWSLTDYTTSPVVTAITAPTMNIVSFAEDQSGELYVLHYGGRIYKFISDSQAVNSSFATQLSATGCALSSDPKQMTGNMIPYDINAKLWSDNSVKYRWFALPENGRIHIRDDGDWEFPIGSVLRKDFYLNGKIIETRLLAHHSNDSWAGYSYEWNDEQTDATMRLNGLSKAIDSQTWTYPSSRQCMQCHTQAANIVLGPETSQMNRTYTYAATGETHNQLDYYNSLGLFDGPLPAQPAMMPDPMDTAADVASRARAYLHANCSHCHRPGGGGRVSIDFRYDTALAGMSICDLPPGLGAFGINGARLLAPGDPAKSIISYRMKQTDDSRMPKLGTALVDTVGVGLIDNWITSVTACP